MEVIDFKGCSGTLNLFLVFYIIHFELQRKQFVDVTFPTSLFSFQHCNIEWYLNVSTFGVFLVVLFSALDLRILLLLCSRVFGSVLTNAPLSYESVRLVELASIYVYIVENGAQVTCSPRLFRFL